MKMYWRGGDLMCETSGSLAPICLGWIEGVHDGGHRVKTGKRHAPFHVLCMWMSTADDTRTNLWPSMYPEEHDFATYEEAEQALRDAAAVAIVGGFRGR
ncbi:MAG: hypothetical protein ACKO0Z_01885 [Betaproteobacteria bacterium]